MPLPEPISSRVPENLRIGYLLSRVDCLSAANSSAKSTLVALLQEDAFDLDEAERTLDLVAAAGLSPEDIVRLRERFDSATEMVISIKADGVTPADIRSLAEPDQVEG